MRLTMRVVLSSGVSFGDVPDVKMVVLARLAMSGLLKIRACNGVTWRNKPRTVLAAKPDSFAAKSF